MHNESQAEVFHLVLQTLREQAEALNQYQSCICKRQEMVDKLYQMATDMADKHPHDIDIFTPDAEEQIILDLYDDLEDGAKLSTPVIAKMLNDSPTNGRLKRRLAEMVRKGFLANDGTGYRRIFYPRTQPNSVPAA